MMMPSGFSQSGLSGGSMLVTPHQRLCLSLLSMSLARMIHSGVDCSTVEFNGSFFEGGAARFSPFAKRTKYIEIMEEGEA